MSSRQKLLPSQNKKKTPYVLFFEEIDASHLPLVGGKGANLGELTHAGLPVPPGFCVTTEAYLQIAGNADLSSLLTELANKVEQPHLAEIATTIREHLLKVSFSQEIASAVRTAYASLGKGLPLAVAVRSSATAEDLPFASFAGQQDTYLNIVGEDALLNAVRQCWASLWAERAVIYRITHQIDPYSVSLSVVIQRMVEVEVAGVLFTANPLTGRRSQTVIDASPGLGEAVVSGAVNPDHFVVNTVSGEIIERRLGDKRVVIQAMQGGGTQRIEHARQSEYACLTDEQVRELAHIGAQVEAHYHAPQDTEWAIDTSGKIWLTQARPITTLYPLPASAPKSDKDLRVYFSLNVAQGVYQPFTPMGIAVFRLFVQGAVNLLGFTSESEETGPNFFVEAGMRLFIDITTAIRHPIGHRILGTLLPFGEARSSALIQVLATDPRLQVRSTGRWSFVRKTVAFITCLHLPRYLLQALLRPNAARQRVHHLQQQLQHQLSLPSDASSLERLNHIEHFSRRHVFRTLGSVGSVLIGGFLSFALAGKLLGTLASADERQSVLRSLPFNPTTQMDLTLWNIAQKILADQEAAVYMLEHTLEQISQAYLEHILPPVIQENLADFFHAYGHRGIAEIDIGLPRWSDDPTYILGALLNYLQLKDANLTPDILFARGEEQAEAMVRELTKRAMKRNFIRGWLVNICLRRTRALLGMREQPKFYLVWILARMREILSPVGQKLVSASCLEQMADLYFLSFGETRAALAGSDMRSLVRERRAVYEQEMLRRQIPRILLSDGSEPTPVTSVTDEVNILRGTPASAGTIIAKARIILNPSGAHLEPGEILVTPSTDPGWTPLFLTAGGLVMEMGGSMSHGAVVAREYGIPAVVGVAGALEHIQNGQMIQVDGSAGRIVLIEEEERDE